MKNLAIIFENSLLTCEKNEIPNLISELVFSLSYKKIVLKILAIKSFLPSFLRY